MISDYLKYWTQVLVLAIAYTGFYLGGNWVWAGFLVFPVLAILDSVVGRDYRRRGMSNQLLADIPLWICAIGPILLFPFVAWQIANGAISGPWQMVGSVLSIAWTSIVPLAPAAHELYHKRHWLPRALGRYGQLCQGDSMRDIAHVVGHHIDVATVHDGDTAPRGMTLYQFVYVAVRDQTLRDLRKEAEALNKRGKPAWHINNRVYRSVGAQVLLQAVVFAIGGWMALAVTLPALLVARYWAEAFNYFQHYGLVREVGSPIGRRHLWNHLNWFSRVLSFEITNHADHHLNSYKRYYQLTPHREAIEMPSLFGCFFASLIPPLWHEMIAKPALKRWDLEYANAEERALAREANRKAGWPDWLGEAHADDVGTAATVGC